MRDAQRELAELKADRELWNVNAKPDIEGWIAESYELAKAVAYDPITLRAVSAAQPGTELPPIVLPGKLHAGSWLGLSGLRCSQRLSEAFRTTAWIGANVYDDWNANSQKRQYKTRRFRHHRRRTEAATARHSREVSPPGVVVVRRHVARRHERPFVFELRVGPQKLAPQDI